MKETDKNQLSLYELTFQRRARQTIQEINTFITNQAQGHEENKADKDMKKGRPRGMHMGCSGRLRFKFAFEYRQKESERMVWVSIGKKYSRLRELCRYLQIIVKLWVLLWW